MRDRGKYPDVALLIRLRSREFGTWLTSASRLTSALRQKQSFELWLSSIIGVTAYSQKHAPTINPRMKLNLAIEEQFMPGAASLANPPQRCRLRRAAPSTWWNDHETPSPRPAHRLIPSQFIQGRHGVYDQREWRKGEPPACAMDTKQ